MKITVTGSLGNIGQPLVKSLVSKGHQVTVISSDAKKIQVIEALGAKATIGSVEDLSFVFSAFEGADAVYTMVPPNFTTHDLRGYIRSVGENYAWAIRQADVKYVVNLSSIGAHRADGAGPTGANHAVEKGLNALADVHVLHLRPGMFYTNFYGSVDMIWQQNRIGNNFNETVPVAMTHPHDIAAAAAEALDVLDFTEKNVRYVVSDVKTGREIADILGHAIGKPDLTWVEFSDVDLFHALLQSGMSEQMASVYLVEIGVALRNGTLLEDYYTHAAKARGGTRFEVFANAFAHAFTG